MKKESKKPETKKAGVFSRSEKMRKKTNYKPVESRSTQGRRKTKLGNFGC